MLDTLIQSKTRLKLLLRFFLNPDSSAYLRGLAQEFDESTNSVRVELNRFEQAGLIQSRKEGNKKMYQVNSGHPLYSNLRQITFKHFGLTQIMDQVIEKIGNVEEVWLTGELARGLDAPTIDITLTGSDIDRMYLARLVEKAETLIGKKIRTVVYDTREDPELPDPSMLIYGGETQYDEFE